MNVDINSGICMIISYRRDSRPVSNAQPIGLLPVTFLTWLRGSDMKIKNSAGMTVYKWRPETFFKRFGMSKEEYLKINYQENYNERPIYKYSNQKSTAIKRKIEWKFNFSEWWQVWQNSGKWDQRGGGYDNYVMGRFNDSGPYSPDNVYICKGVKNAFDFLKRRSSEINDLDDDAAYAYDEYW